MEWWQIILLTAIVVIIGAAAEVYVRLAPQRQRRNEERRKLQKVIKNAFQRGIIVQAKAYRSVRLSELEEACDNPYIQPNFRAKLAHIVDLAREYDDWRHESWHIVNTAVKLLAQSKEFEWLNDTLKLFIGDLGEVFRGSENSTSEPIYQAIYQGNLTFELARDSLLKNRWNQSTKFDNQQISLKDVIESGEFHKFIEESKELQKRQSLQMLGKARERLLEKAQLILKEVS